MAGSLACGVLRPHPRWSNRMARYTSGSKDRGGPERHRPRAAVDEQRGLAVRVAVDLPVDEVAVTWVEHPVVVRFGRGEGGGHVLGSFVRVPGGSGGHQRGMELFPAMPLADWQDTKATLHRFTQIVGKIRLAAGVRRNHWWGVPFHLTGRGITTRPMGRPGGTVLTIDFDFLRPPARHHDAGRRGGVVPAVRPVRRVVLPRDDAGAGVPGRPDRPGRPPAVRPARTPDRPFADDTEHATYDPLQVTRYWQVLSQVNLVLEEFAAGYSGKISPVHHFWHTFDIACTRFSDRVVDQAGERPGDAGGVLPRGDQLRLLVRRRRVRRAGLLLLHRARARRAGRRAAVAVDRAVGAQNGSHLAILRYDDARAEADPRAAVLAFYESAYQAGARRAGWDVERLACPGGVTDART